MSISKDELLKRKEEIVTDYNNLVTEIEKGESQVKTMRNNLSALAGALQQTDLFIKQIEDAGDPMPEEKKFALDMATSQEKAMIDSKIIEETEESNSMVHETLTTNPRGAEVEVETPDESSEQEKKEDEKL